MKHRKRYIWAVILCCYFAAVIFLCLARPQHIPAVQTMIWGIPTDKIAHFLMFLPYPVIAYIAFRPSGERKWAHLLVLTAVFAVGIGMAIGTERLQGLADYRSYEIEDFYADVFGMECSSLITALYIIIKKHKT
ncbi:MAG: VanZ family protein [Bacteroidales bacterium]|nr:VanZ family protein [Bacteroidales bacterium]